MEIRISKPSCQKCGSKNIKLSNKNSYYECNNCGYDDNIELIFEEEPQFCNCELCKALMIDKSN